MKRGLRAISVTVLAMGLMLYASRVAHTEQDPSSTFGAAKRLTEWFAELLKPFAEIGATAERQHLIDGLIGLNRDLYDVEQDKRYAIVALRRRPLNKEELVRTAGSLEQRLERLRSTLKNLAPQLRVAYRKGADDAIKLLTEALVTRKGVVVNLALTNEASASHQADEASATADALSRAQSSLADAIANLQRQ